MHRIDYPGTVTESGKRRYKDQSLPTVPGTILGAEAFNAIQEEIAGLIEAAGITLQDTNQHDRATGWVQLRTAIFSSGMIGGAALTDGAVSTTKIENGAVTDDKITDVDLAKTYGEILTAESTTPTLKQWRESINEVYRYWRDNTTGEYSTMIEDSEDARYTTRRELPGIGGHTVAVEVRPEGIKYYEDPDNTGASWSPTMKQAIIQVGTAGWVEETVGIYVRNFGSRIPKTRAIFSAVGAVNRSPAGLIGYDGNFFEYYPSTGYPFRGIRFWRNADSPFWQITLSSGSNMGSAAIASCFLHVTYAGE